MARVTLHIKSWYEIEVPDHVAEKGNFAIMDYVRSEVISIDRESIDNGVLYEEVVEIA